jgi:predicted anti-sigma-YlaC factor YlaD
MHRLIRDHLEEVLAGSVTGSSDEHADRLNHLHECEGCRQEVDAMREHADLLRQLRTPSADLSPRPGFYARVMDRIEAQGAGSIWAAVFESQFGRRIALASITLAVLLGVYLVTSEQSMVPFSATSEPVQMISGEDQPGLVLTQGTPDRGSVLVNLVTYQEQ